MADDTNDSNDDDGLFDSHQVHYIEERNTILADVKYETMRKAWFTLSHMLLPAGSKAVHMGSGDGEITFTMAALNPEIEFIGVDKNKKTVAEAQKKYILPNLTFKVGDISDDLFEENSIDAFINSYILHRLYSESRYNDRIVSDTIRRQYSMLKEGGSLFIHDYAKPSGDEYVLMEMHDKESLSEEIKDLSQADLLVWYSEHAQPKQDPGCRGFFLEELPPRFPRTRLFRLPYKWAYEFIMRKDQRDLWENNLPFEFTFFTIDDFRKDLNALGARVQYSAPQWNEDFIRKNFEGKFRLLNMAGDVLGDPATSFVAVARKMPEQRSLSVKERRIAREEDGLLDIKTLRDQVSGDIVDVVTRNKELAEILPYRTDERGRMYVYLHEDILRGISNAVGRTGVNIDQREWSGHMVETISTDYANVSALGEITPENTKTFMESYIGLKPEKKAVLESGPHYYPDPSYIDERVSTHYVKIKYDCPKSVTPLRKLLEPTQFQEKGVIREFNAQSVLDAISVGLIPNSRLELQLLSLMQHAGVKYENWISRDVRLSRSKVTQAFDVKEFLRQAADSDKRFKEVKGSAGQLRSVNSVFVEEGVRRGGRTGLASEYLDFVVSDERTVNTAVILPITKGTKGDVHAGFNIKHMPVPQRYEGTGIALSVPQFNIPKEIVNYRMLKQFIAEKFGVTPNMVLKLGESYFNHVSITPQRIHPFAIAAPANLLKGQKMRFIPIRQYMMLWKSLSKEQHFMVTIARAYRYMPSELKMEARQKVKLIVQKMFDVKKPDWSLPIMMENHDISDLKVPKTIVDELAEHHPPPLSDEPEEEEEHEYLTKEERAEKIKRLKLKLGILEGDGPKEQDQDGSDGFDALDDDDLNLIEQLQDDIDTLQDLLDEEDEPDAEEKPKPE